MNSAIVAQYNFRNGDGKIHRHCIDSNSIYVLHEKFIEFKIDRLRMLNFMDGHCS